MDTETLKKIKDFAIKTYNTNGDKRHGIDHIQRVADNALSMVKKLGLQDQVDTHILLAACYLHDIATKKINGVKTQTLYNHIFERKIIKDRIDGVLGNFDITEREKDIIRTAVINHPYSLPYRRLHKNADNYTKILQDADTLDYISAEREKTWKNKGEIFSFFVKMFLIFSRKKIKYFLNFPELAKDIQQF